ncbi:membrane integrity-associated transporter subunit PqiC [Endozoicomonas sp. ONNA2]|uniref:PqiC family protein n=1 Tax=Endozoicomonas sp. ONNA2 TaxID=2828741 RepID=UPI0021497982|nr:ABC-type transport auxiliary lipoprotein family protein [Endozoicomonas sp. ONNA2]
MKAVLAIAAILFLLAGCGAPAPQTTRYLLAPVPGKTGTDFTASEPIIRLAPVAMDNLMGSHGIVYQTSPTEVLVARHHLWAENISTQLSNRLLTGLRQGQTRYWPVPDTPLMTTPEVARLLVNVQQFNGSYQGYGVIAGQWSLLDGQGALLKSQPFSFREPLASTGYTALVDALSTATDRLIAELSRVLSGLNYPQQ